MVAPEKITVHNVKARIAAHKAKELAQLKELAEATQHLIEMRSQFVNSPCNKYLLWAEWHFHKAHHDFWQTDESAEAFGEACCELGVDADGDEVQP